MPKYDYTYRNHEDPNAKLGPRWFPKGAREHPYSFEEARDRLSPMLEKAASVIDRLPAAACPEDKAMLALILHPEFLAPSYYPQYLLDFVKLDVVGTFPARIFPERRTRNHKSGALKTNFLFARAARSDIAKWSRSLPNWKAAGSRQQGQLIVVESIFAPRPETKIMESIPDTDRVVLEAYLFQSSSKRNDFNLEEFLRYMESLNLDVETGRNFMAGYFGFVEIVAPRDSIDQIAEFSGIHQLIPVAKHQDREFFHKTRSLSSARSRRKR